MSLYVIVSFPDLHKLYIWPPSSDDIDFQFFFANAKIKLKRF